MTGCDVQRDGVRPRSCFPKAATHVACGPRHLSPATALFAVEVLGADADLLRLGTTVSAFLSLHHYITDGVLWKLRSPDVRRQLFAHLPARA